MIIRPFVAVALLFAVGGCDRQAAAPTASEEQEAAPAGGIDRSKAGTAAPDVELRDKADRATTLASLRGKPVLVNLWASWCAPCVRELPTLEALSLQAGAPRVIAVSQDMGPRPSVDAFLKSRKIERLEGWHDPKMALSSALNVQTMPTSVLYGADGKEIWRFVGDLDWTSAEAAKLLAEAGAPGSR